MSYLAGLSKDSFLVQPAVEEDCIFVNLDTLKPPTAERAEEVKQMVMNGTKVRSQFLRTKDYVEYLVEYLREKAGTDFNWPMSIVVRLADLKALEVTGFISKKEMEQYIAH